MKLDRERRCRETLGVTDDDREVDRDCCEPDRDNVLDELLDADASRPDTEDERELDTSSDTVTLADSEGELVTVPEGDAVAVSSRLIVSGETDDVRLVDGSVLRERVNDSDPDFLVGLISGVVVPDSDGVRTETEDENDSDGLCVRLGDAERLLLGSGDSLTLRDATSADSVMEEDDDTDGDDVTTVTDWSLLSEDDALMDVDADDDVDVDTVNVPDCDLVELIVERKGELVMLD